jgi:hypothetical protein
VDQTCGHHNAADFVGALSSGIPVVVVRAAGAVAGWTMLAARFADGSYLDRQQADYMAYLDLICPVRDSLQVGGVAMNYAVVGLAAHKD